VTRGYAARQGLRERVALDAALREKAEEFKQAGAGIYFKP
jgi:hypothetical protein